MSTKHVMAVIGAALLFVGAFSPVVTVPILGDFSYFQMPEAAVKQGYVNVGHLVGVSLVVLAGISLSLALTRKYAGLWFTGSIGAAIPIATFFVLQAGVARARSKIDTKLQLIPIRLLAQRLQHVADASLSTISIQWGCALLLVAAALLLAAASMKDTPRVATVAGL